MTVDNVEIGRRIRRTREALGFPEGFQEYFAKNWFGISKGTWGTYENGRNGFPLRAALKLKVQFGIPTDWIYAADPSRLPLDVAVKLGLARRLDPDAD